MRLHHILWDVRAPRGETTIRLENGYVSILILCFFFLAPRVYSLIAIPPTPAFVTNYFKLKQINKIVAKNGKRISAPTKIRIIITELSKMRKTPTGDSKNLRAKKNAAKWFMPNYNNQFGIYKNEKDISNIKYFFSNVAVSPAIHAYKLQLNFFTYTLSWLFSGRSTPHKNQLKISNPLHSNWCRLFFTFFFFF